jgi:hypothetical protein
MQSYPYHQILPTQNRIKFTPKKKMKNIKATIQRTENITRFYNRKPINAKTPAMKQTPQKTWEASFIIITIRFIRPIQTPHFPRLLRPNTIHKTKQIGMCEQFPNNHKNLNSIHFITPKAQYPPIIKTQNSESPNN